MAVNRLALGALYGALLMAPSGAAGTVPADLCTGDPCVVSSSVTVDADSVLDFTGRSLVLAENVTLRIGANGTLCGPCDIDSDCGTGTCFGATPPVGDDPSKRGICLTVPRSLTLIADDVTLRPGARILGDPKGSRDAIDGDQAQVSLQAVAGNVTLQAGSGIDVRAECDQAGDIEIVTQGDAVLGGDLIASARGTDSMGGEIRVEAAGAIDLLEEISVETGGEGAIGGQVDVLAGFALLVEAPILASGGSGGGGTVRLLTASTATVHATIAAKGGDPDGDGGHLGITAGEDIVIKESARLLGIGGASGSGCGDGMSVDLSAGRHLIVDGDIEVQGGFDCKGGDLLFQARLDFVQSATSRISTSAGGPNGRGGLVEILTGRGATLYHIEGESSGFASEVLVTSPHFIDVLGKTSVRGFGNPLSVGGRIELRSCTIGVLAPGGELDARSRFLTTALGSNVILPSGAATISGTLQAAQPTETETGVGNFIRYRTVAPTLTGSIDPEAVVAVDPTLPECGYCGDGIVQESLGEICDDGSLASCHECTSLYVETSGSCGARRPCYATAQAAAAATGNGGIVHFASEFFDESVTFDLPDGDQATLEGGWNATFSERNDRILTISRSAVPAKSTLRALTIRGGTVVIR